MWHSKRPMWAGQVWHPKRPGRSGQACHPQRPGRAGRVQRPKRSGRAGRVRRPERAGWVRSSRRGRHLPRHFRPRPHHPRNRPKSTRCRGRSESRLRSIAKNRREKGAVGPSPRKTAKSERGVGGGRWGERAGTRGADLNARRFPYGRAVERSGRHGQRSRRKILGTMDSVAWLVGVCAGKWACCPMVAARVASAAMRPGARVGGSGLHLPRAFPPQEASLRGAGRRRGERPDGDTFCL